VQHGQTRVVDAGSPRACFRDQSHGRPGCHDQAFHVKRMADTKARVPPRPCTRYAWRAQSAFHVKRCTVEAENSPLRVGRPSGDEARAEDDARRSDASGAGHAAAATTKAGARGHSSCTRNQPANGPFGDRFARSCGFTWNAKRGAAGSACVPGQRIGACSRPPTLWRTVENEL